MLFLDYIERHPWIFAILWVAMLLVQVVIFYSGGRKAERRFRDAAPSPIRFRERGGSGHSTKSILTRLGGASGLLEVVVTDAELWIKGMWPPLSYIGTRFDLVHRVARSQIHSVDMRGKDVALSFTNETGAESQLVLVLKAPQEFVTALTT